MVWWDWKPKILLKSFTWYFFTQININLLKYSPAKHPVKCQYIMFSFLILVLKINKKLQKKIYQILKYLERIHILQHTNVHAYIHIYINRHTNKDRHTKTNPPPHTHTYTRRIVWNPLEYRSRVRNSVNHFVTQAVETENGGNWKSRNHVWRKV